MAILSYLLIYDLEMLGVILTIFPSSSSLSYKIFVLIVAIMSVLVLLKNIYARSFLVTKQFFNTLICYAIIIMLFCSTQIFYNNIKQSNLATYISYELTLVAQTLPGVLIASIAASTYDAQEKMKRLAPIIGIIFTVVSLITGINPTASTSAGLAESANRLDYQTISYMAAYGSAFLEYYLITKRSQIHMKIFQNKVSIIAAIFLIFVDLTTILISGGRGGLVAYFVFFFLTILFLVGGNQIRKSTAIIISILAFLLLIIGGYIAVNLVENSSISTNGFSRIIDFINGGGDTLRRVYQRNALDLFLKSPIIGNGLGSVLIINGIYSHNIFLDALAETGLFGTIILLAVLFKSIKKGVALIRIDETNYLWIYIFMAGFIMSMFSGYWLTQFPVWWVISFMLNFETEQLVDG